MEWRHGNASALRHADRRHAAMHRTMQLLCAQELLAGGDDGLADGLAGPDGAYDEWRRLYGAEWARWYGLQVRAALCRARGPGHGVQAAGYGPCQGFSGEAAPLHV